MRVTRQMMIKNLVRNIHNAEIRQQNLFNKVASGKEINKPSDDPMGVKKIISLKDELAQIDRFQQNAEESKEYINFSEQSLNSILGKLEIALATAQQAANATVDAQGREMLSAQIQEILESVVSEANTKHGDKYLFGGTVTRKSPFNLTTEVQENVTLSAVDEPLSLQHVQLSDGDITVEAAGKGYSEKNFTIDRKNGTITVLAGSEMESDGVTDFTISYRTSDPVTVLPNSGDTDGKHAREIIKGDVIQINVSGENLFVKDQNVFDALRDLKNALLRNDVDKVRSSIASVDKSIMQVSKFVGVFGLKYEHVQNVSDSLDNLKLQMQSLQSHIEDTNLAEASVKLELATTGYQAVLSSASRMINISLLDYLR